MADEGNDKTHDATPYRRQKAAEEGQVAKSQDLTSSLMLLVSLITLWYLGGHLAEAVGRITRTHLGGTAWINSDEISYTQHCIQLAWEVGKCLLPMMGILAAAAIIVHVAQSGLLFLPEKVGFDFNRINPLQNYTRIFSLTNVVHLGFGLLKTALIAVVAGWGLMGEKDRLLTLVDLPINEMAAYMFSALFWICIKIAAALFILAVFDYGYQYWKHEQDLKMSTQELRDELKNQQGDPQVAARRKQVQRQMLANRLTNTVPKADVIVSNPTELAIALQYDPEKMAAPIVIAKGAGVLAQRIRRLALENGIPVVERKELARHLYAHVEINHPVPSEQYAAVAEVVRYVYQLKGKKLPLTKAA